MLSLSTIILDIACLLTLTLSTLHYACCYDEIKGNQDLRTCSHADCFPDSVYYYP